MTPASAHCVAPTVARIMARTKSFGKSREADLEAALQACRGSAEYDCLVNLSGGKDSCYLLYRPKRDYSLNVLAFTTDMNVPEVAWDNIRRTIPESWRRSHRAPAETRLLSQALSLPAPKPGGEGRGPHGLLRVRAVVLRGLRPSCTGETDSPGGGRVFPGAAGTRSDGV